MSVIGVFALGFPLANPARVVVRAAVLRPLDAVLVWLFADMLATVRLPPGPRSPRTLLLPLDMLIRLVNRATLPFQNRLNVPRQIQSSNRSTNI